MMEATTTPAADILIRLIRTALAPDGSASFAQLVLYTSFGVVRGRIGYGFSQELAGGEVLGPQIGEDLIELNAVTVEHFSNHLANASFERLYVRLRDVNGFAFT